MATAAAAPRRLPAGTGPMPSSARYQAHHQLLGMPVFERRQT